MKFKVMTYNVAACRSFENGVTYRPIIHAEKQYAEAIKNFAPDICGLNEIDYRLPRSGCVRMAKMVGDLAGYRSAFAPAVTWTNKYGVGTYGNGFLSHYPILDLEFYPIPDPTDKTGDPENAYYESRVILHAVVDMGRPVDVFVTHFGLAPSEARNAAALAADLVSHAENPAILMGDFNLEPDSPVLDPIRAIMTDTYDMAPDPKPYTFPSHEGCTVPECKKQKIDYIFVSHDIKVLGCEVPECKLSDHKPYIAYIDIPESKS